MTRPKMDAPRSTVDMLNSACFCFSLDETALTRALDSELGQPGLAELVRQRCPFLFSAQPVFVAAQQLQRMAQVMQAIESVVALPAYREQVLAAAPPIASLGTSGPMGVFFEYGGEAPGIAGLTEGDEVGVERRDAAAEHERRRRNAQCGTRAGPEGLLHRRRLDGALSGQR